MLIIALPPDKTQDYGFALSLDGVGVTEHGFCAADQLPKAQGEVVALMPWQAVSWHTAKLPNINGSQRQAALLGLLEDQWLQPAADLHWLSWQKTKSSKEDLAEYWVAACDRNWLRSVLAPLEAAGCRPSRLIPEFTPATADHDELHLIGHGTNATALWCNQQGVLASRFQVDEKCLSFQLALGDADASGQTEKAQTRIWVEPQWLETVLAMGLKQANWLAGAQRWLKASRGSFDMAQGEWGQSLGQRWLRNLNNALTTLLHAPDWKPVRWCLLLTLMVNLVAATSWVMLDKANLKKEARYQSSILTSRFPETRVVIDPLAQMQQAVRQLRLLHGAADNQDFDVLLTQLGGLLKTKKIMPQSLTYEGSSLKIEGIGTGDLPADALSKLKAIGYAAESQTANQKQSLTLKLVSTSSQANHWQGLADQLSQMQALNSEAAELNAAAVIPAQESIRLAKQLIGHLAGAQVANVGDRLQLNLNQAAPDALAALISQLRSETGWRVVQANLKQAANATTNAGGYFWQGQLILQGPVKP